MNKEVEDLLSQLTEAMNGAKRFVRTIYVYKSGRAWWISGKLPKDIKVFYVAYPNGELGRSDSAPDINADDWTQFSASHESPIFGKTDKPQVPARLATREERMFKMFMWYAAFAPYAQFVLCLVLGPLIGIKEPFDFAAMSVLICAPLIVIYAVVATTPKTIVQATIGIESYVVFLGVVGFFSMSGKAGSYQPLIGLVMVLCMAASAASMLMVLDILGKGECLAKK